MFFDACRQVEGGLANVHRGTLSLTIILDDTALRDIKKFGKFDYIFKCGAGCII